MTTSPEDIQSVTNLYFRAWEKQDVELLQDIFSPDAIYKVKPFGIEEHEGLEAIKEYWESKVVSLQKDPRPKVINQAIGKDTCFVEWETSFTTHDQTQKVVRGILLLLFKDGKVNELREHYATLEN
jgi:ketosteroid isomerase-like protein